MPSLKRLRVILGVVAVLVTTGCGGDDDADDSGDPGSIEDRRASEPELFELDQFVAAMNAPGSFLDPDDPDIAGIVDTLRNAMEETIVEACDDASADEDYTGAARDIRKLLGRTLVSETMDSAMPSPATLARCFGACALTNPSTSSASCSRWTGGWMSPLRKPGRGRRRAPPGTRACPAQAASETGTVHLSSGSVFGRWPPSDLRMAAAAGTLSCRQARRWRERRSRSFGHLAPLRLERARSR
jgi:hypothetical protein